VVPGVSSGTRKLARNGGWKIGVLRAVTAPPGTRTRKRVSTSGPRDRVAYAVFTPPSLQYGHKRPTQARIRLRWARCPTCSEQPATERKIDTRRTTPLNAFTGSVAVGAEQKDSATYQMLPFFPTQNCSCSSPAPRSEGRPIPHLQARMAGARVHVCPLAITATSRPSQTWQGLQPAPQAGPRADELPGRSDCDDVPVTTSSLP
jgi:hypothetical protein